MGPDRSTWRAATVVAVLAATASCAGGGGETSASPTPAGVIDAIFAQAARVSIEEQNALQTRAQETLADCMAEQGFDYVPFLQEVEDWDTVEAARRATIDADLGTREFAQQYGYGWSTGVMDEWSTLGGPAQNDPNDELVNAMSGAQRAAYEAARYGPDGAGGCEGSTWDAVYGDEPTADDTFAGLQEEIGALWLSLADDPRQVALDARWSACMAGAGYDFDVALDAENSILGLIGTSGDANGEVADDVMATIAEEEIAVAVADFDCRAEVGYAAEVEAISVAAQDAFYAAHRDEVDAFAESLDHPDD